MSTIRTTIHGNDKHSGTLHVDYNIKHEDQVFLYMSSGGFMHCLSLNAQEARLMAEALLKAAYAIEEATPKAA